MLETSARHTELSLLLALPLPLKLIPASPLPPSPRRIIGMLLMRPPVEIIEGETEVYAMVGMA